jgi:hypothetical protein
VCLFRFLEPREDAVVVGQYYVKGDRSMKRTLAAGIVAALALIAPVVGSARAGADPADLAATQGYFRTLAVDGVPVEGHETGLMKAAFAVCDGERAGSSDNDEEIDLMNRGYGPHIAAYIINAAEEYICIREEGLPD